MFVRFFLLQEWWIKGSMTDKRAILLVICIRTYIYLCNYVYNALCCIFMARYSCSAVAALVHVRVLTAKGVICTYILAWNSPSLWWGALHLEMRCAVHTYTQCSAQPTPIWLWWNTRRESLCPGLLIAGLSEKSRGNFVHCLLLQRWDV